MKQLLILATVFCLLATTALAADVTEKNSGFAPGSIDYRFPYEPDDQTVVRGIVVNDVVTIIHPDPSDPRNPLEYRILFRTRNTDGVWAYEHYKVEKGLSIAVGEMDLIDLDRDGEPELAMEYTAQVGKEGTFTFYPASSAPAGEPTTPPAEEPSAPQAEEEAPEAPAVEEAASAETPQEESAPGDDETAAPAGDASDAEQFMWTIVAVVIAVLVISTLAIFFALRPKKDGEKDEDADPEPSRDELPETQHKHAPKGVISGHRTTKKR